MEHTSNGKVAQVVASGNLLSGGAASTTSAPSSNGTGSMNGSASKMSTNGSAIHMDEVYSELFMDVEDSPASYFLGHHHHHHMNHHLRDVHGLSMMLSDELDKKIVDKIVHLDFFNKFDDLLDLDDLA